MFQNLKTPEFTFLSVAEHCPKFVSGKMIVAATGERNYRDLEVLPKNEGNV